MPEKEAKKIIGLLGHTSELIPLLKADFDFQVDPYDPLIDEFIEIIKAHEKIEEVLKSDTYLHLMMAGLSRHFTMEMRFGFYKALWDLGKLDKKADEQSRMLAMAALEDIELHPILLSVVNDIYHSYIVRLLSWRLEDEKIVEQAPEGDWLQELQGELSESRRQEFVAMGNKFANWLMQEYKLLDDSGQLIANILRILANNATYRSAGVVSYLLFDNFIVPEQVIAAASADFLPFFTKHMLHKVSFPGTDVYERWSAYEFLAATRCPEALDPLCVEMRNAIDIELDDDDAIDEFYMEIAEALCALDDRRAIPALIHFLHKAEVEEFPETLRQAVGAVVQKSPWAGEIEQALQSLRRGELVFVGRNEEFSSREDVIALTLEQLDKEGLDERRLAAIQASMKKKRDRWNAAYHEDLEGLRPIDIPTPRRKMGILQRMADDFKDYADLMGFRDEEFDEQYQMFQSEWMVLPGPNGKIPLVEVMAADAREATTPALQANFHKHKQHKITLQYQKARDDLGQGKLEMCEHRLHAILELEPSNPFALHLLEQLGKIK